jgi:O-acetylhomoserine/O-acetylserine sulfhydrylase-like pyridoxal-dependent enzyme
VNRLLRALLRRGLRRGILEGSTAWLAVGLAAALLRLARRREPAKVYSERLRVGERLEIVHLPAPPTKRQRAALRRRTPDGVGAALGFAPGTPGE